MSEILTENISKLLEKERSRAVIRKKSREIKRAIVLVVELLSLMNSC